MCVACARVCVCTYQVEELGDEMADYVESANAIRDDINRVLERSVTAAHGAPCGLCGCRVGTSDHYVFPCTHRFHCACLVREACRLSRTADPGVQERVQKLETQIRRLSSQLDELARRATVGYNRGPRAHQARQQRAIAIQLELLIDELDKVAASKCPFCSDVMIQAVGTAFISQEEEDQEGALWRL